MIPSYYPVLISMTMIPGGPAPPPCTAHWPAGAGTTPKIPLSRTSTAPKVLFYAMGGGLGHASRCRVLASWLPASWISHFLLPERLREWADDLASSFPPRECQNSPSALAAFVSKVWREVQPSLFLVDVFPRGILGELAGANFPCPSGLIARWVKPSYAGKPAVVDSLSRYAFRLDCERTAWDGERACPTLTLGPVAVVAPVRRAERGSGRPQLLWMGSGPRAAQEQQVGLLDDWCRRRNVSLLRASPVLGHPRGSISAWLAQVDLVVSAAGYNAYHEILQSGVPALFWPQERLYDQQELRAQGLLLGPGQRGREIWHKVVADATELLAGLQAWWLLRPQPLPCLNHGRPDLFQSLVQQAVLHADHIATSAGSFHLQVQEALPNLPHGEAVEDLG